MAVIQETGSNKQCEGVGWIHLAQDKEQWWALVSIVMNIRVP